MPTLVVEIGDVAPAVVRRIEQRRGDDDLFAAVAGVVHRCPDFADLQAVG